MVRTYVLLVVVTVILCVGANGVRGAGPLPPATQPTLHAAPAATQPAAPLTLDLGNKVTMKLNLMPAGKFVMGSPLSEDDS